MALLLPQGIGHSTHVGVKHWDAERIAHAIDHDKIALTAAQVALLRSTDSLTVADIISEDQLIAASLPAEFETESAYNLITTSGLTFLSGRITGNVSVNPLSAGYTRIGVGDSSTAASVSQTDLQGTNKYWKQIVASGYPSISGGVIQWQSVFGSAVANFAWNEWALDNGGTGTAGGTANDGSAVSSTLFFNRSVASLGTKASGTTATITVTITES